MRIFPDSRAWLLLTIAVSPILAMWTFLWVRRPDTASSAMPVVGGVLALVYGSLLAKTITVDDGAITQGWRPFATRIAYADIARIHHVVVSSRYGSSPNLAITASGGRREIRLPMKSFNLQKRRWLVKLLVDKAPGVRVDRTAAATLT